MRSQTSCTSSSRWLHMRTVLPLLAQVEDQVLHPAGAERVEAAGRLVEDDQLRVVDSAWARPMRCRMPLEYSLRMRFLSAARPTISISSAARLLADVGGSRLNSRP